MGAGLGVGRAPRERAYKLLRCAATLDRFFTIRQAFDEKEGGDVRAIEVIEKGSLVEIQAFERGFVENKRWPLRHKKLLQMG